MYINLSRQICNAISYIWLFKISVGTHSKLFESSSAEAKAIYTAALNSQKTLFTEDFPPNALSRLISGSHKQFNAVWEPTLSPFHKTKRGRLRQGLILSYRLCSPVEVVAVDTLTRQTAINWEG